MCQARRGIWQFNEPKVAIKLATVFIGTQISNGIFVFVITSFIFALIVAIFAWQLTWDVVTYAVRRPPNSSHTP